MKYNNKIITELIERGFSLDAANKIFEKMMDDFYLYYDKGDNLGMNIVFFKNGFTPDPEYINCFV